LIFGSQGLDVVAKSILQFGGFIAGAAEQAMTQTPDLVFDFHP
jgi:hypothetical protein